MFLGTGSAEPSKYRAGSAILLKLPGTMGSLLMDCGEGTWGQMLRCLGPDAARQQVAALRCVWMSHKHADHALGLPGLLAARPAGAAPLLVVGPWEVERWLHRLHASHGYRAHFVHCRDFKSPMRVPAPNDPQVHALGATGLGLVHWQAVPVNHCHDAFGLVLQHSHGWKLVYSGDTRPCPALIRAGSGATLLIHEATFEPELEHQAISKRHSTSAEAMHVAKEMKAYSTILTHFSQRYPRVPAGLGLNSEDEAGQEANTEAHGKESSAGKEGGAGGIDAEAEAGGAVQRSQAEVQCCDADSGSCSDEGEGGGAQGGCEGAAMNSRAGQGRRESNQRHQDHQHDQASHDQIHSQQQQQQQQQQGMRAAPVMMAFDGMLVPMSMLPCLPVVAPVIAKVLRRVELLQSEQEQQLLAQGGRFL